MAPKTPKTPNRPKIRAEDHLGLVGKIVGAFKNRGVDHGDLFQEGVCGLMRAIEKYDPTQGTQFSTYAQYWIRCYVLNALKKANVVNVDPRAHAKGNRINAIVRLDDEAMATQHDSPSRITMYDLLADLAPHASDGSCDDTGAAERLDDAALLARLDEALRGLTRRERRVLELRFGIGRRAERHTLAQAGRVLGLSRERVRQIEAAAILALRKALQEVSS